MKNTLLITLLFSTMSSLLSSCTTPFETVEPLIESKGYYNLQFIGTNTKLCKPDDYFALEYKVEDKKGNVKNVIACTDRNGEGTVKVIQ